MIELSGDECKGVPVSADQRWTICICQKACCYLLQRLVENDLYGITKDSVVLDIGASVVGFIVMAAQRSRHTYAVEPLHADILRENISLNKINNCTVLEYAVGDKKVRGEFSSGRITRTVQF